MRAAVVIGVDNVEGGLPKLSAAAEGASDVAMWLERNDYEVDLLTDQDGRVTRAGIFDVVEKRVAAANVQRLIIYFAGHGFLKGPLDEFWLLSRAPTDSAEAVNVTLSAAMARYKGIPEIIFISDACRVVPKTGVHSGIVGASIFPASAPKSDSAEIDFYYGTHPGDPAFERNETEAERAHGLFTQELLDAHINAPAEALLEISGRQYVRNRWLKKVLKDRVDDRAQKISLALTQKPDVQLQIENGYIALNEATGDHAVAHRGVSGVEFRHKMIPRVDLQTRSARPMPARQPRPADDAIVGARAKQDPQFQLRMSMMRQAEQDVRGAIGTPSGSRESLTCFGDSISDISVTPQVHVEPVPLAGSSFRFRLDTPAAQAAIRFADGSGMLVPLLREYSCEIVRRDNRTVSIAYSWLVYRDPNLAELRAEVLSAASLGLLNRSRGAARKFASKIRMSKRSDPVLGLVAALTYAVAGDFKGVKSVREFMRNDLEIDLFDAWLLAGGVDRYPVFPSAPLLSQTWSFIDAFDAPIPEELKALERVPGFWTVFDKAAMDAVMRLPGEAM